MNGVKFLEITRGKIILLLFLVFASRISLAQKHDSLNFYEKIKRVADKSKFATLIYQSVFVEPKPTEYPSSPESKEEKIVNPYIKYEGSVIRKINIKVYDPFGHSITDTTEHKLNFIQKTGNRLHIKSKHWVIQNKFLFKINDTLNPLSLSETERLLRQSIYVNDARIFVSGVPNTDSVDVNVIVLDESPSFINGAVTDVSGNASYTNQNLLGFGQQFQQYVGFTKPDLMDYSGYYNVANIDHTYISSRIAYATNKDGTSIGLSFDRPFYSPLTKWAGGINVNKSWKYYPYTDSTNGELKKFLLQSTGYDVWAGKSFKINSRRRFFNQSTNIIVGERYYANVFDERPSFAIDKQKTNLGTYSFIGNVGLSVQQFYKEKFIYRFGANEDVPHGFILQFLYGATKREFNDTRYYTGMEIARALHIKEGYFSATLSYGIFFNKYSANDITANFKMNYFCDLYRIGKWYFREFVNYNFVIGMNKMPSERVTLSSGELYGFNPGSLSGTSKMVMNIETVAYAPYNLAGFRFAPVLLIGGGMIGDQNNNLLQSNLYQAYALGLMVRNENLLINTFEISFGAYPFLPDGHNNVFKLNPIAGFTLRVRVFSISKPSFISY
jgi:hypothetical protein